MIALKGDGRLFTTHVLGCVRFLAGLESESLMAPLRMGWLLYRMWWGLRWRHTNLEQVTAEPTFMTLALVMAMQHSWFRGALHLLY